MKHALRADHIAERNVAAVAAAFKRIFLLPALNLLGQLCGIVLGMDSRMMPSGPSEMFSLAEITRTPFFFRMRL